MIKINLCVVILLSLTLASCATIVTKTAPTYTDRDIPAVGQAATVAVGERMLLQAHLVESEGITILETTEICSNFLRGIVLQKGLTLDESLGSDGKKYYCGSAVWNNKFEGKRNDYDECFTPLPNGGFKTKTKHVCDEQVDYRLGKIVKQHPDNIQKTLLYSGKSDSIIYLSYREFVGDVARPAFTQDLTFDINSDSVVGARGALLKILNVSNTSITYEVISTFK